ncbi:MAG TPA: response regulator [Polyangiaceae bacterium]|jgi:signal transduction histidine kinase|nr:response regulator [Polyangiaceae bacterium]
MNGEPVKFLIVDDVDENLEALEALLRRDGLEILKARSGLEALELLLVHDVALALLDVQMPAMDGFELAELMRGAERTKHVPIIFVTAGRRDPQRLFKGYESGAVDFLYKPIEPVILQGKADVFFELYRQRHEYAQALRLNEMFIGILGHDLRNPLGALVTGTELLKAQVSDEKQQRTLRRMASAGQRMTEMIEQLLDLTRARLVGGLGFARKRHHVEVSKLVQRTVEELRAVYPERNVVVTSDGNCTATGDPDRLLQLFSNLLANALHHGEAGTDVSVWIGCSEAEVTLKVHNGGSIPAELLPLLFDPFRKREPARGKSEGLGLGLFISQQIAQAHGGGVEVQSHPDSGTTFTVRLPRAPLGERITPADGVRRTVLVIEDDEHLRQALCEAFVEDGYRALDASSGDEAVERLGAPDGRPDVVILGLVLPASDANRIADTLRADPALAGVPIIAATSNLTAAPPGVLVVPKPLKLDRLLDQVAKLWSDGVPGV